MATGSAGFPPPTGARSAEHPPLTIGFAVARLLAPRVRFAAAVYVM
ncbi:hypothetical protein [Nocardia brasiliensis]|nr:hypothetical protein [Nocardia brasiliensis]